MVRSARSRAWAPRLEIDFLEQLLQILTPVMRCDPFRVGKIYTWLGLTLAVVESNTEHAQNRPKFQADITFITAQELCFTFLKDQDVEHEADIVRPPCKIGHSIHKAYSSGAPEAGSIIFPL